MRWVATGYDPDDPRCARRYLLEQLRDAWPASRDVGFELAPAIDPTADVLLVLIDRESGPRLFKQALPSEGTLVVGVLLDLHRSTLPFLKLCDKVVYTNPYQRRLVEELIGLRHLGTALPLPSGGFRPRLGRRGCIVWHDDRFAESVVQRFVTQACEAQRWHASSKIDRFYVVVDVPPSEARAFADLRVRLAAASPSFIAIDRHAMTTSEVRAVISRCVAGQFFSSGLAREVFEDHLTRRDAELIDYGIADRQVLADFGFARLTMAPVSEIAAHNFQAGLRIDHHQFARALTALARAGHHEILAAKRDRFAGMRVDTLADLHVVRGGPRDNAFVFSICFRNQLDRIARCLASVAAQRGGHDVGVVIVDDASDDGSLDVVLAFLDAHAIPACVVRNLERKRAARNFFNVVHHLVTRDDCVVIELDGDDLLAHDHVLDALARAYGEGAELTRGSYRIHPEGHPEFPDTEVAEHHALADFSRPWNLGSCAAWLHLRSCRRRILRAIEREHYADRRTGTWLASRHDSAIQPRAIELAAGRAKMIDEVLYVYDVSGTAHDHDRQYANEERIRLFLDLDRVWRPILLGE